MAAKAERIRLTDGLGLLEVRGGEFDSMLLCGGEPIAMHWHDCGGSVAQYLWRAGQLTNNESQLTSLRGVLNHGLDTSVSLYDQCRLLIQLFVNGRYNLVYDQAVEFPQIVELVSPSSDVDLNGFYPYPDDVWIITQTEAALDPETIARHREAIDQGYRPVVVVAAPPKPLASFLIDGHHKLRAYEAAGVNPWFLSIDAKKAVMIDPGLGKRFLRGSRFINHYLKHKREP